MDAVPFLVEQNGPDVVHRKDYFLLHEMRDFLQFFFFQAEDGIRDGHVTGVQTCALPISPGPLRAETEQHDLPALVAHQAPAGAEVDLVAEPAEIGRASCRERV